jgi:hypothetical protein
MADGGEHSKGALNPNTPVFDIEAMNTAVVAAANAMSASDCRLPDFAMYKSGVWFRMVEALFKDCNMTALKKKYIKVLYRLPVNIIKSMATLINNIGSFKGR